MSKFCVQSLVSVYKPGKLFLRSNNPALRCIRRGTRGEIRSRRNVDAVDEIGGKAAGVRHLIKPFAFTVAVGVTSFGSCAIWQYESLREIVKNMKKGAHGQAERFYGKANGFRQHANNWWNGNSNGQKAVVGIIGLNVLVFAMWKIRPLNNFMLTYFASNPISRAPNISMLLSNWSHYSTLHIAANMYVLWSFSSTITSLLGREQFVAFYTTAGVVSGFTSYLYKIGKISLAPSLGASGAIMAVLGAVCSQFPDARLSVAFVDQLIPHSFSAGTGMKALIAMDLAGILLGWRFLDHAAHLGGMLFGIWYVKYGHRLIWDNREPFLKQWHNIRGKP